MDGIQSFALRGYAAARTQAAPAPAPATSPAASAAQGFEAAINRAETAAVQNLAGKGDPHALVEALASSQLAVETAVTVRDRVVEAYQEILRMPI